MDGHSFDRLSRQLAQGTSWRRLLAGLLGGALAGFGVGKAAAQDACPRDEPIRCGDVCADLRSDPQHCGRCGRACHDDQVCYAGRCQATCPRGFDSCDRTCLRSCGNGQVRLGDCACCTPQTTCGPNECGDVPDGCGGMLACGSSCAQTSDACAGDRDCCGGVCTAGMCHSGQGDHDPIGAAPPDARIEVSFQPRGDRCDIVVDLLGIAPNTEYVVENWIRVQHMGVEFEEGLGPLLVPTNNDGNGQFTLLNHFQSGDVTGSREYEARIVSIALVSGWVQIRC